ncbi:RNA polymerase sigma factor [Pontibacter sp. CAU 1760]
MLVPGEQEQLDRKLLQALQNGDKEVLEQLYDRYAPTLMGVIHSVVPDKALAEQVLQQTFVTIWSRIGVYDMSQNRFLTWALAIARGFAHDAARRYKRQEEEASQLISDINVDSKPFGIELASRCRLPYAEKTALELVYLKGQNCAEAAEALGVTIEQLKAHITQAIIHLKADPSA